MVAPQALHLLNNAMVRKLSESFAKRVEAEVPGDRDRQIERVYEIALSRTPSDEEQQYSREALDKLTARWRQELKDRQNAGESAESRALANFCHVIMNSAEFLFVD
jgi:hypothetical protein